MKNKTTQQGKANKGWAGQNKTRRDKTRQDKIRLDQTRQNKTKHDKIRPEILLLCFFGVVHATKKRQRQSQDQVSYKAR